MLFYCSWITEPGKGLDTFFLTENTSLRPDTHDDIIYYFNSMTSERLTVDVFAV